MECEYRPIDRNGRSGERVCASQIASFRRTRQGFAVSPQPANVRKYDDLHQSGYPNYQLHYLGSGLHFSCPNPKRAADGSSSRRLFEKNGLRLFCAALCGAGSLPNVFRLPSYGFPPGLLPKLSVFPKQRSLAGPVIDHTCRAANRQCGRKGKARQMNDQQQRNPLFGKGKAQGANMQMRGAKPLASMPQLGMKPA